MHWYDPFEPGPIVPPDEVSPNEPLLVSYRRALIDLGCLAAEYLTLPDPTEMADAAPAARRVFQR